MTVITCIKHLVKIVGTQLNPNGVVIQLKYSPSRSIEKPFFTVLGINIIKFSDSYENVGVGKQLFIGLKSTQILAMQSSFAMHV